MSARQFLAQQHQLRILAAATTTNNSNNANELHDAMLLDHMAQLFQLTPVPTTTAKTSATTTRHSLLSPSAVAIDALLEDIGDPQHMLNDMVAAATATTTAAAHVRPAKPRAKRTRVTTSTAATSPSTNGTRAATTTTSTAAKKPRRASVTSSPHSLTAITSAAGTKRDVVVNASRERQRDEMTRLTVRIAELEQQLQELIHRSAPVTQHRSTAVQPLTTSNEPLAVSNRPALARTVVNDLHALVAHAAKHRKRRAQIANVRLRDALDTQLKLAKSVERLLLKIPSNVSLLTPCATLHRPPIESDPARPFPTLTLSYTRDFNVLDAFVTAQYAQLDAVLADPHASSTATNAGAIVCASVDEQQLPFAIDAVAIAAWAAAQVAALREASYSAQVVRRTADTLSLTSTTAVPCELVDDNRPHELRVRSVFKQVTESTRRVFLLTSVARLEPRGSFVGSPINSDSEAESESDPKKSATSVELLAQCYAVLESISDDPSFPATHVRIVNRVSRLEASPPPATTVSTSAALARTTGATSNELLTQLCRQLLRVRQQVVEDVMLTSLVLGALPLPSSSSTVVE